MSGVLTDEEWAVAKGIRVDDLVAAAADLDLVVPEQIDKRALLDACVLAILERGRAEGLPFSKYDADDLTELPPQHLSALGRLLGLGEPVTVAAVLRVGERVYRSYQKNRPDNPVALALPLLLTAVARTAAQMEQSAIRKEP